MQKLILPNGRHGGKRKLNVRLWNTFQREQSTGDTTTANNRKRRHKRRLKRQGKI